MSFRQSNAESQRWRDFCVQQRDLFLESGLPLGVSGSQEIFEDFLMHGYLDHHPDSERFTVDELSPTQADALKRLVVIYLREGFGDPGLGLFSHEEHRRLRSEAGFPRE